MIDSITILPIEAKFEGVQIFGRNIMIEKVSEVSSDVFAKNTAYSGIWQQMITYENERVKNLQGKVLIILRNQGRDFNLAIFISGDFIINSSANEKYANTFCKFVQYMFEWISTYVKDKNITDKEGNLFIIPTFLYSSGYFEYSFPEKL